MNKNLDYLQRHIKQAGAGPPDEEKKSVGLSRSVILNRTGKGAQAGVTNHRNDLAAPDDVQDDDDLDERSLSLSQASQINSNRAL